MADAAEKRGSMEDTKKKNKLAAKVCVAMGAFVILFGIGLMIYANFAGDKKDPIDVYDATEEGERVYTLMQYMSDYVAYYESMGNMQFYIAFDEDFYATVICMHKDDLKDYQQYMDYFYDEEAPQPELAVVEGFAQPFDATLKRYVREGYNALVGEEWVTTGNFSEYFGDYYIQIGKSSMSYQTFNIGIYCLIGGVVVLVIGLYALLNDQTPVTAPSLTGMPSLEAEQDHRLRGILGAFLGAFLGGILWTAVGMLGWVSIWIGVLMAIFARTGYALFAGKDDKLGAIVSTVFCLVLVLPATYLAAGWNYYKSMNEFMGGSITLVRALKEFLPYLKNSSDAWDSFMYSIGLGYIFILLGIGIGYRTNRSKR